MQLKFCFFLHLSTVYKPLKWTLDKMMLKNEADSHNLTHI
jgi:hypothetical protein